MFWRFSSSCKGCALPEDVILSEHGMNRLTLADSRVNPSSQHLISKFAGKRMGTTNWIIIGSVLQSSETIWLEESRQKRTGRFYLTSRDGPTRFGDFQWMLAIKYKDKTVSRTVDRSPLCIRKRLQLGKGTLLIVGQAKFLCSCKCQWLYFTQGISLHPYLVRNSAQIPGAIDFTQVEELPIEGTL